MASVRHPGIASSGRQAVARSGSGARVLLVLALAGVAAAAGCARSIVSDGAIRPEPFAAIIARVEQARGIQARGLVDARVVSSGDLRAAVARALEEQWPPQAAAAYQDGLVAVGLWPRDQDLFTEFVDSVGAEAGGLYVPSRRVLYVVDEPETPFSVSLVSALMGRDLARELLLGHELTHLLQHQAYPALIGATQTLQDQDDVVAALQAAIEGDAVRISFQALDARMTPPAPVDLESSLDAELSENRLHERAAMIRYGVPFPYTKGYRLAMLEADLLLERPPISTEQVLHPSRREEGFQSIDLRPLRELLPAECAFVYENTAGELGLSYLFRDLAASARPEAWEGWNGDRYLVARCGTRLEFVWLTTWDSPGDADEFAAAYAEVAVAATLRAGLTAPAAVASVDADVVLSTAGLIGPATRIRSLAKRHTVKSFAELCASLDCGSAGAAGASLAG